MLIHELQVPVPWGHIAGNFAYGWAANVLSYSQESSNMADPRKKTIILRITVKAWGDSANDAVMAVHGGIDNAGSFDTLIPLLPQNFYYLCLDLPGHGLSSHFPAGLPLHVIDFVFAMRNVTEYFKRDKYILLGHSFGGRISLLYTQLYPERVSKIANIDVGYFPPRPPERFIKSLIKDYEMVKKTHSFSSERVPRYTYEEIVNRIMKNRMFGRLTFETAEQLAKRMIKEVDDGKYELTYDQRLRTATNPSFSEEYIKDMFKKFPITCPAILIQMSESIEFIPKPKTHHLYYFPNSKIYMVNGHHHCHHTNPESVAPILTKFLLNQNHKL